MKDLLTKMISSLEGSDLFLFLLIRTSIESLSRFLKVGTLGLSYFYLLLDMIHLIVKQKYKVI